MFNKILILIWYLKIKFYLHFFYLIFRKFLINHDSVASKNKSLKWAAQNAISYEEAFKKLEIHGNLVGLDCEILNEGNELSRKSKVKMGGSGHIHLLYDCVRLLKAKKIIETGVAYGWSSLAILKALSDSKAGTLYSVDMPLSEK